MDGLLKKLGFNSIAEFTRLTSKVPIKTQEQLNKFEDWKLNDGTKEGLLKLMDSAPEPNLSSNT